jgi:hypothetical protein
VATVRAKETTVALEEQCEVGAEGCDGAGVEVMEDEELEPIDRVINCMHAARRTAAESRDGPEMSRFFTDETPRNIHPRAAVKSARFACR